MEEIISLISIFIGTEIGMKQTSKWENSPNGVSDLNKVMDLRVSLINVRHPILEYFG